MNQTVIREAGLRDLDSIVEFNIRLARETEMIQLDRAVVTAGVRRVLEDPSLGRYYVAEREVQPGSRAVAGQLMVTFEWSDWRNGMFLWIQSVYVAAEHRRHGVFTALFRHVESIAAAPGNCGLRLYVHDENATAQETYSRLGMVAPGYRVLETPDSLRSVSESLDRHHAEDSSG